MRRAAALCLALACSSAAPALAQRANLTLHCEGCFGMKIDLDAAHLLSVQGVSAADVNGKLTVHGNPRFEGLMPGPHHIRVTVLQGPLDSVVYYDGPIYLRPGTDVHMQVAFGSLVDFKERPLGNPDGGSPAPQTSLSVRVDDPAICDLLLDGRPLLEIRTRRVAASGPLTPGLHTLEVRTAQGQRLSRGSLFLTRGEQVLLGLVCKTGAVQALSDPHAYAADPRPLDGGA